MVFWMLGGLVASTMLLARFVNRPPAGMAWKTRIGVPPAHLPTGCWEQMIREIRSGGAAVTTLQQLTSIKV